MARIRFGERSISLPRNRALRIALGVILVLAGALGGWLPILGFWMVPLGLIILSVDIPSVRRWRRKTTVAILSWWRGRKDRKSRSPHAHLAVASDARDKPRLRDSRSVP
jgi:hypothetical protein